MEPGVIFDQMHILEQEWIMHNQFSLQKINVMPVIWLSHLTMIHADVIEDQTRQQKHVYTSAESQD